MKKYIIIILMWFLLTSCQNSYTQEPTENILATITPTRFQLPITWTPVNIFVGNNEITKTPTFSPTPFPTKTVQPIETTMIAPTQILQVDLPEWLSDNSKEVLIVAAGHHHQVFENLALVNAEDRLIFDLPAMEIMGYFWMPDGEYFGVLLEDGKTVMLVDVENGVVSYSSLPERALRYAPTSRIDHVPVPITVVGNDVGDSDFLLIDPGYKLSNDTNFVISKEYAYTSIIDIHTDEIITITHPDEGFFDLRSAWFPTGAKIGIAQSDIPPGPFNTLDPFFDYTLRLIVYDANERKFVNMYENIPQVNWSPNGEYLLYQPYEVDWYAESAPCIYNVFSNKTECFNNVISRHKTTDHQVTFSSLRWSPKEGQISYVYSASYQNDGGLCLLILADSAITCILEDLEQPEQSIIAYEWSPSGKFIVFRFDWSSPYSDTHYSPQLGVYDISTGEYFVIGDHIDWYFGLWRP